jgi:hypothetical protein
MFGFWLDDGRWPCIGLVGISSVISLIWLRRLTQFAGFGENTRPLVFRQGRRPVLTILFYMLSLMTIGAGMNRINLHPCLSGEISKFEFILENSSPRF